MSSPAQVEELELSDRPQESVPPASPLANQSSLPPVDGGFRAWSFLAAAFVVEAIVWGSPDAYGVFLDAYLTDERFASQKGATAILPLIGTLSSGIIYCTAVLVNPIAARYPQHRRKSMWLGVALCCGALVGASYATKIAQLLVFQGILYALGGVFLYLPCISFLSEWFVVRRGTANGILFAGTAAGGLVLPLILPRLIAAYGISKTLRYLGISLGILLTPLLPFVKGRIPHTRTRIQGPAPRGTHLRDALKSPTLWLVLAVNTIQALAYFVPLVYLPTFAGDLNLGSSNSALTVGMLNGASVIGRLAMGYLSDRYNFWSLALTTLGISSLATFILWGVLSHSLGGLLAFGVIYGSIAGGWTCLWSGFVRPLAKDDVNATNALFGYLLLSRGIGNIVSTPISARLYSEVHPSSNASVTTGIISSFQQPPTGFAVGDGRFKNMILYVGTCFAGAAIVSAVGWGVDVKVRRDSRGRS